MKDRISTQNYQTIGKTLDVVLPQSSFNNYSMHIYTSRNMHNYDKISNVLSHPKIKILGCA